MNFNKHKQPPSPNNNQLNYRQKTIPLNDRNMHTNPTFNNNHTQPSSYNPNQYSQGMSPRNANNTKSPRPIKKKKTKKKEKRNKNINDNSMHRIRSHTAGHNIIGNNNSPNSHNTNSNTNPALYMSTTQNISPISPRQQKSNNQTWVSPQHRNNMNSPVSPRIINNNYDNSIGKPPPQRTQPTHQAWNSGNMNNNNNIINGVTSTTTTAHNQTGTMIQHINQNTITSDISNSNIPIVTMPNLYDDMKYHNRQDCVWSIDLFQQREVAMNFACQTCCDIPKIDFAYTCDKELIYCEYCIDIKYRQNEVKQKRRMPVMVRNMISELKLKCPRYSSCKWRGNVRNMNEHLKLCMSKKKKLKKKNSSNSASECPLKYMGCTEFQGGYLNKHYNEYQELHLNYIICYFENKFRKYDNKYSQKLQQFDIEIKKLQTENIQLKNEVSSLLQSKIELSQQLAQFLQQTSNNNNRNVNHNNNNNNNNNNRNGYKIVVNNAKERDNKINENNTDRNNGNNNGNNNGQWNSFLNAHRRLSTKTGATIPENENSHLIHNNNSNNYPTQLLSNPHSYKTQNTANSSSYDSSIHSEDTASEGWFHKLPNHPLLNKHLQNNNQNNQNNNNSKPKLKLQNKIIDKRHQLQRSHNTQDTQTELSVDTFDDDATYIPEDKSQSADDISFTNEKIMRKIENMKAKGMIKSSTYFKNRDANKRKQRENLALKAQRNRKLYNTSNITSFDQTAPSMTTDSVISVNSQTIGNGQESHTNFGPTLNLMDIDEISTTNDSLHKNRLNVMENIRGKARSRSTSYQREIIGKNKLRKAHSHSYSQHTATTTNQSNQLSSSSVSPPSPPRDIIVHNNIMNMAESTHGNGHTITPWDKQHSYVSDDSTEIQYHNNADVVDVDVDVDVDVEVYDDDTTTNNTGTNYSCTISVRRAIQHLVPNYYEDAKQMELPISDQKMVVIDIGSQLSKVGLAGSNKPSCIFQSMVASHQLNGSRAVGKIDKLTNYKCSFPIDRGIIKSFDDYESIIHSIFYDKLQINPCEYNSLMIEPILSPKKQSLKILEICFEKFNLNALFLAIDALCALYASGGNTGLSVSSGHGMTSVVPIYEGYVIPHAAQKLEYGGLDISNYLQEKLNLHGLFRSLLSENKFADSLKQKLSYVASDFKIEKQHTLWEKIVYRLPDGSEIEVGQERFECCEQLFNNKNIHSINMNNSTTISELINKSLLNASEDIRQVLFENIVCSGGNTMLKGFDDRLKKEVDNNAPENSGWKTRVFGLVDRKLSCWIGGSIMASLSHMDQLWITRKQYQDIGPNILNQQY